MKRLTAFLLALSLCFLCACAKESEAPTTVHEHPVMEADIPQATAPAEETTPRHAIVDGKETDLLTIDDLSVSPQIISNRDNAKYFSWTIKVRNNSGRDLPVKDGAMYIWYRYLDANKDIVYRGNITGGYHTDVAAGQAERLNQSSYPTNFTKEDMESIVYLEFYQYKIRFSKTEEVQYEFVEPILVNIREEIG